MEIIELVENCKLVRTGSEENGHDCWGNYEYNQYKYVIINGKEERCWDGWYVIHNGKNVKEVVIKERLETRKYLIKLEEDKKKHFEKTGFDTPAEYKAYLKGIEESKSSSSSSSDSTTKQ